ncbi:MAG: hypothetical protein IJI42_05740 [Methanobrevibacter sp.]|nr:hypothetical protein [Methanobrevibacter sp.]
MNLTLTVMFHGLELDFMQHHDWFVKEVPNSQQLLMLKRPVMFPTMTCVIALLKYCR